MEETITVSGQAPIVDVQRTQQQQQFQRETLQAIPGTGRITGLARVIPGAALVAPTAYSVGGVDDTAQMRFRVHGAPESEAIIDGTVQAIGSLVSGAFVYNQLTFQKWWSRPAASAPTACSTRRSFRALAGPTR